MIGKTLFAMAAILGTIAPSGAETVRSLVGEWTITVQDSDCQFGGYATVRQREDGYSADVTMRHVCPMYFADGFTARQSSKITIMNNQVSVRSKVIEVTPASGGAYAPDHFALTMQSDSRLFGTHFDQYGSNPAEWVRSEAGTS